MWNDRLTPLTAGRFPLTDLKSCVVVVVVVVVVNVVVVVVVVVVLTLTRIIKSVVTGQAPVTLELRNTCVHVTRIPDI